ncbi:sugar ABC transporter permease [Streptomyces carpaticus]|uniref:Multiple sugar transport system permease protein n=2 Tax=Streptomyces TaxID=1883 RepID=A0A1I6S3E5_9ACTN|nr:MULTISPECIES: sugar ABC transporter permease [Streptomyces]MCK1813600.1 sugar ABC transporter permease [Streptomyces sp. XM4011]QKV68162.1 sugar ABC transporter permease [Streptomyces harbinensis]UWM48479.1 sugar ABC transporter permease [Streptomyces carpaticus]SFS71444.1 multiple sugar transport system permease protein [Streptomyces harbinensis]
MRKHRAAHGAPRRAPYLFLLPAGLLFALFFALPIGYAGYLSLRKIEVKGLGLGSGARSEVWAGFSNYTDALTDPVLLDGALRVLVYGLIVVPLMLGLALLFALMLDSDRVRGRAFTRLAIFLPYAVPGVIAALLWGFLYLPSVSPLHYTLDALGLPQPDLLSGGALYVALSNIAVWGGTGFNMIVIYTALRAIPAEVYEAARLDGCSQWQIAWRIKIPMVAPSLVLTFFFSVIATLQVFNEPTTLRPLTNSLSTTWSPMMKVYQDAFVAGDIHSGAATAVIIAVVTFALSFGFLRLAGARTRREENR